ncbi:MAG: hypothetical protein J0H43_11280, partial [Actinobacteria bacterium]|nr:hypothetical protein [Actinomycetota bacterium]
MRLRALTALLGLTAAILAAIPEATSFAYPPGTCATLSVSTTVPLPGESITVTGAHFDPNSTIALKLVPPGTTLTTVHSSSTGTFTTHVTMPSSATGNHDIVAVGGNTAAGPGCPADPAQTLYIQSTGTGGSTGAPASNGGGGGPAMTGLDIAGLIAAALAL